MARGRWGALAFLALAGCAARTPSPETLQPALLPRELAEQVLGSALRGVQFWLNLPAPYCLVYQVDDDWVELDAALLRRLSLQHPVLRRRDCPPTYSGMIRYVDSLGRDIGPKKPPGYINPYQIRVTPPVALTRTRAVIRLEAWQGSQGWLFYCEADIAQPHVARCGEPARFVS